mgnify:CR=1 FL=1
MKRLARLLLNNFWTLLFALAVVFLLLILREDALSPFVWAFVYGETNWQMTVEDHGLSSLALYNVFWVLLALFALSTVIFTLFAGYLADNDDERGPPARVMDEDVNRFTGLLLGSTGIYLAAAAGGTVLYSSVFGAVTILWGFQLVFMAEEDKDDYTVSGASKLFGGKERQWEGDPLFRAWARKVKERFKRQEEEARAWQQRQRAEKQDYERQRRRASYTSSEKTKEESGPARPWTIDDPWSVLGVEPGTPMKKITQKWRRLCKRYHPDVVPTGLKEETEEALKKINAAYRMIKEKHQEKEKGAK